ncbi:transposase [Streptomyces albireticuli]
MDLSVAEWVEFAPLIPSPKAGGGPLRHSRHEVIDALAYWLRGLPPHGFPPWQMVYHYWRVWRIEGRWEEILAALRVRERAGQGRDPTPVRVCWTVRVSRVPSGVAGMGTTAPSRWRIPGHLGPGRRHTACGASLLGRAPLGWYSRLPRATPRTRRVHSTSPPSCCYFTGKVIQNCSCGSAAWR